MDNIYDTLLKAIDDIELRVSEWVLDQLLQLDIHVLEFIPLRASTYLPLPKGIVSKKAIVNIHNKDDLCFLWAVIAAIYGDPEVCPPERVAHYRQWEHEFNLAGIAMPMALKDNARFERMNNISISVYGYKNGQKDKEKEKGFVYPLQVAQELKERHVNMLLISNENTSHYCLIKNFSRLVPFTS